MPEPSATALPETTSTTVGGLEPDAIGVAQDTIIGMASSAPAATMAVTMAGLAAAAAYGGGPVILLCGIPMIIITREFEQYSNATIIAVTPWRFCTFGLALRFSNISTSSPSPRWAAWNNAV